jgi:hypothetical protein
MGASATLSAPALSVDPGGEAVTEIKVRNTGGVVDQYVVDVLGDAGPFARVEPNVLNLFPGAEGTATIKFQPPKAPKTPAGVVPFGVRVWSKEDPEGSTVQEGQLDVAAFVDTSAELMPRTSRGRRKAKHELAIDNRGNTILNANVSVVDPDELVTARVDPPTAVAPPGSAVFQTVIVKPKRTFLKGAAKTIPFQVIVSGEGQPPVTTDGAMVQEQILPKWLLPAALLALAGLIAAFILWQTVLKPRIETAAQEAVAEEAAQMTETAEAAEEAAEEAQESAAAAEEAAGTGGGAGGGDGGGAGGGDGTTDTVPEGGIGPASAPPGSTPQDFRLTASVPANANPNLFQTPSGTTFDVPNDKTLQVTDIVFQNPNGDTGRIQVRRGNTVLFEIGLANFRDYDYHFVTPLQFTTDQNVVMAVQCTTGGLAANSPCSPAASFTGFLEPVEE